MTIRSLIFALCALPVLPVLPAVADPVVQIDVPIYATSLVGTPYRWGGTAPGEGFDCSGLVAHVFAQAAGLRLPRSSYELSEIGMPLDREALEPGDLVFFNTQDAPYSHVGIYVGESRFVHAASSRSGILLSRLDEPYWREHYEGARRIEPPAGR